jgi:aspartyl-tRNA(Asn)/glutamyl-tRNA(Gln) amidotransferase subunit B
MRAKTRAWGLAWFGLPRGRFYRALEPFHHREPRADYMKPFQRRASHWICLPCRRRSPGPGAALRLCLGDPRARWLRTESGQARLEPLRKQLKDEAKARRVAQKQDPLRASQHQDQRAQKWELTVGIEIHAQLNAPKKLFSAATTLALDEPNRQIALFDLAFPGSQPHFQKAVLLPALRAAIALNCRIQRISKFDRKHYFYQDQPAGYQITQYYEPFARDGHVILTPEDGIASEDGESVRVGIRQIQMEQDTAKTVQQPPDAVLLDFNRVGHPLIEIITLPQIHDPQTAAACVRKIQSMLQAVGAVTTGMEMGGLRADVNVSVRPRHAVSGGGHSYHGVQGLGQRTEIKNLSSFKAVEDAIIAERDRQIRVLEAGGTIEGETRGWSLGSTETTKLRGKEGEVDYRYMPDPDLAPLIISNVCDSHPPPKADLC